MLRSGIVFAYGAYFRNGNAISVQIWRPTGAGDKTFTLISTMEVTPAVERGEEQVSVRVWEEICVRLMCWMGCACRGHVWEVCVCICEDVYVRRLRMCTLILVCACVGWWCACISWCCTPGSTDMNQSRIMTDILRRNETVATQMSDLVWQMPFLD